jgi:protein-disulfide isomerase
MKLNALLLITVFLLSGCVSKDKIKTMLKENPDILTEAISANPEKFIDALNAAVKKAQGSQEQKREVEEKKKLEESFDKPLIANIRPDELIRGVKGAPIKIVEYSDFECPFCSRGFKTVLSVLEKYKGKVQFVYKHLPLSFHPQAMVASRYYEAIRMQSHEKAIGFHDAIYDNQRALQNGEKFLKAQAKKLDVNMSKLAIDIKSEAVKTRIEQDVEEAAKYGFQGTPGFLLNGVPIKGAYPLSHFEKIINELKKRGKIKL